MSVAPNKIIILLFGLYFWFIVLFFNGFQNDVSITFGIINFLFFLEIMLLSNFNLSHLLGAIYIIFLLKNFFFKLYIYLSISNKNFRFFFLSHNVR